jgi:hypothetical protein
MVGAIARLETRNEYALFVDRQTAAEARFPSNCRVVVGQTTEAPAKAASASGRRSMRDLLIMRRLIAREPLDLLFFPCGLLVCSSRWKGSVFGHLSRRHRRVPSSSGFPEPPEPSFLEPQVSTGGAPSLSHRHGFRGVQTGIDVAVQAAGRPGPHRSRGPVADLQADRTRRPDSRHGLGTV